MTENRPWRASESRPIRPFRISRGALANVGFRMRSDLEFTKDDPWTEVAEPEEIRQATFRPEFQLMIDAETLERDTTLPVTDLRLSVIVRDPAAWRSERVADWPLEASPPTFAIPAAALLELSGARGLELALQVTPLMPLEPKFRTASRPGQLVANRQFRIKTSEEGGGFPIKLVESAYMEELGLPKNTVWFVQWKTTVDFDQPVEDVLCVLINKESGEKLLRISAQDSLGNVLWREIASEVFLEICLTIFSKDPEQSEDKDSLLGKMVTKLTKESGVEFDQLVAFSKDITQGARFFRSHLQTGLDLSDRINQISLAGRVK